MFRMSLFFTHSHTKQKEFSSAAVVKERVGEGEVNRKDGGECVLIKPSATVSVLSLCASLCVFTVVLLTPSAFFLLFFTERRVPH